MLDDPIQQRALNKCQEEIYSSKPSHVVIEELQNLISSLYNDILSSDGKRVEYNVLPNLENYQKYIKKARELQRIDLEDLSQVFFNYFSTYKIKQSINTNQ